MIFRIFAGMEESQKAELAISRLHCKMVLVTVLFQIFEFVLKKDRFLHSQCAVSTVKIFTPCVIFHKTIVTNKSYHCYIFSLLYTSRIQELHFSRQSFIVT